MLLKRDEIINKVEVYQSGDDLKKGLIDIDKIYERVTKTSQDPSAALSRQEKWKAVVDYMAKNPSFLLDSLPSAPRQLSTPKTSSIFKSKGLNRYRDQSQKDQRTESKPSKLKSKLQKDITLSK